MSSGAWRTVLVLGGIASGRAQVAASLLADESAASRLAPTSGQRLAALAELISHATPDQTLVVDELEAWLPPAGRGARAAAEPAELHALREAIARSPARLVLTSSEVGMTMPTTAAGRGHAEAVGALNRAVADTVDAVALVVAGQPSWLKGGLLAPAGARATAAPPRADSGGLPSLGALPQPDGQAQQIASERAAAAGLGDLAVAVGFAAATQGATSPLPWRTVRVLALHGDHPGAACAGARGAQTRADALRQGLDPLAQLAAQAGAQVYMVATEAAAAMEDGPTMSDQAVEDALVHGWQLAERAADEGVDMLVLASIGDGAETAAAAVAAVLGGTGAEPAMLLGRVSAADGTIDDAAWIARCAAIRDAVWRAKAASRTTARATLAELGGPDLATATGVILGAAARRTPVLWDGPVGAAAALAARSLAGTTSRWCLVPSHGGHPTVVRACDTLSVTPVLTVAHHLGEGAATLLALPLLRSALLLASTAPAPPTPAGEPTEPAEPTEEPTEEVMSS